MMPSPFSRNHFHPQQGHLDHKPTQCYDISSGKQKCAKLAPNDLLWVINRILSKVQKSFWSCTHVNRYSKFTLHINQHILVMILIMAADAAYADMPNHEQTN